jgi:hypothetical protein
VVSRPVGQAQVGQDDLLAQLGIAAGGVGLQPPALDGGRRGLVAWQDLRDRILARLGKPGRPVLMPVEQHATVANERSSKGLPIAVADDLASDLGQLA